MIIWRQPSKVTKTLWCSLNGQLSILPISQSLQPHQLNKYKAIKYLLETRDSDFSQYMYSSLTTSMPYKNNSAIRPMLYRWGLFPITISNRISLFPAPQVSALCRSGKKNQFYSSDGTDREVFLSIYYRKYSKHWNRYRQVCLSNQCWPRPDCF